MLQCLETMRTLSPYTMIQLAPSVGRRFQQRLSLGLTKHKIISSILPELSQGASFTLACLQDSFVKPLEHRRIVCKMATACSSLHSHQRQRLPSASWKCIQMLVALS